jgi:hypothetical protein
VSAADDVARVARVALAEDDLARVEAARHADGCDAGELAGAERREGRHPREQIGGHVLAGVHA